MAIILEKTDSAYYPCFRTLFNNVVCSLAEAKEISMYLTPLRKSFKAIEEVDFSEAKPLIPILIHVVGLAWAKARYYQNSAKLIVLFRQISNLLIQAARKFLDPSSIFQSDVDEALQRVQISKSVLEEFKYQFEKARSKPGMRADSPPWTFNSSAIFNRLDLFLKRLADIEWLFRTVLEFSKLEKIEIGGILGRSLSLRIVAVVKEFQSLFASFSARASDVLEPDDESFAVDCAKFSESIMDLDSKLAAILCQAFDDCSNLESAFKLINIAGTVLNRPVIRKQFTDRYSRIYELLNNELTMVEVLFNRGVRGAFADLPPLAAALQFTSMLRQRINLPMQSFKTLQPCIVESKEGQEISKRYERLINLLTDNDTELIQDWTDLVPDIVKKGLQYTLLTRDRVSILLKVNFDADLLAALVEVNYLKKNSLAEIPEIAFKVAEKSEIFRKFLNHLSTTVTAYNDIRRTSRQIEYNLIELEVARIDSMIARGEKELCWDSDNLADYINELETLVQSLWKRLKAIQLNIDKIHDILEPWTRTPLIERKEHRKDTLLALDERADNVAKRYADIQKASEQIHKLLEENKALFEISSEVDAAWEEYVEYVDDIVIESLRKIVGCCLSYLSENMDPVGQKEPLLEAKLELREPDLYYEPSLDPDDPDSLEQLIVSLLSDIMNMATLVPRLKKNVSTYRDDIEIDVDIKAMKNEIMSGVNKAINEATEFCGIFEGYAYLWLEDRETVMHQFLEYGRQLTIEEMEMIAMLDPKAPPKATPRMDQFREQIDLYEGLYLEIEEMKPSRIFCGWFRVNLRPFKQSLLNTVCKWSSMFKKHLVERVTTSLSDLGNFIRLADESLLQQIQPGDYAGLISVMGYLMRIKERQPITDDMFQPLQETIELLKFYDQDIPEEVNVFLQELPEQYDCENAYGLLDEADRELCMLERQMKDIQDSASLFEVSVPEFKQLKQCRRELRMLKQLWDYVFIVRSSIEGWKTTPWRKIDVENMDIECKKFAKEIR
ncbi:hypothetical protein G9C98_001908, partial [Cotesia typhae]